jgi:hypothetical protein
MLMFVLFEIGMTFFVFGFVTLFFIPKYQWDRLRRDFDFYWPQLIRDHYGPKGRIISLIMHFVIAFLILIFIKNRRQYDRYT